MSMYRSTQLDLEIDNLLITYYGGSSSANYGTHQLKFVCDRGVRYYSYNTMIAFIAYGHELRVRRNEWGPNTAKHIREAISDAAALKVHFNYDCLDFTEFMFMFHEEFMQDLNAAVRVQHSDLKCPLTPEPTAPLKMTF